MGTVLRHIGKRLLSVEDHGQRCPRAQIIPAGKQDGINHNFSILTFAGS